MIGIVQVGRQAMADRYAYLPLLGIFIMVCWGLGGMGGGEASSRRFAARRSASSLYLALRSLRASPDRILGRQHHAVDAHHRGHAAQLRCAGRLGRRADGASNRLEEAIGHFRQARRFIPSIPISTFNIGVL